MVIRSYRGSPNPPLAVFRTLGLRLLPRRLKVVYVLSVELRVSAFQSEPRILPSFLPRWWSCDTLGHG